MVDENLQKRIDYILNYETTRARKIRLLSRQDAEDVISMCLERVARYGHYEFEFVLADFMRYKYGSRQNEKGRARERATLNALCLDKAAYSVVDKRSQQEIFEFESCPIFERKEQWRARLEYREPKKPPESKNCRGYVLGKSLTAWAKELGCGYQTLLRRKLRGWSDEEIINTPIGPSREKK